MPQWRRTVVAGAWSILAAGQAWAVTASANFSVTVHLNPARDPGCVSQLLNEPTQSTVTVRCPGGNIPIIRPQHPAGTTPLPHELVNDRLAYWRLPVGGGLGLVSFGDPFVGTGTVTRDPPVRDAGMAPAGTPARRRASRWRASQT